MHFTREPIIETVITARDGYKLTVRSTKGVGHEEYTVEAVEIISFGKAQFFRSMEKPKPFLLPVTDFEVLETKETRVLLKGVSVEKSIKIGGGREGPVRAAKEQPEPERSVAEEEGTETAPSEARRKDRKRHRRRRANEERSEMKEWGEKKRVEGAGPQPAEEGRPISTGETPPPPPSPLLGTLIPPPTTLISESLARYKDTLILEPPMADEHVNEPPKEKGKEKSEEEASSIAPHVYPISSEDDNIFLP